MYRPRPCLGYPQASDLPHWGHILPHPPTVCTSSAASLRRDPLLTLCHPLRHNHASTRTPGYWNNPSQPAPHQADHRFARRSLWSTACNLADVSVDQNSVFYQHTFHIPYPTMPLFPNTWPRPEVNDNDKFKVPILTTPAVTPRFRRSITAPSLGTKKISAEKPTILEANDKTVMLKYYQDDEPREPKQREKRTRKSKSVGSLRSYTTVQNRQTEARLQTDVVTDSKKKPPSGCLLPVLERLDHLGQQITNTLTRREPIDVCMEQDILTRDESDGITDELPKNPSRPKTKTSVRPPTPSTLERSDIESSASFEDPTLLCDIDDEFPPPLVIDIPGTSDSSSMHRPTFGNVHDSSTTTLDRAQNVPSESELSIQTTYTEPASGQQLTDRSQTPEEGTRQTIEHPQGGQYMQTSERIEEASNWQTTECTQTVQKKQTTEHARDTHRLHRSEGPQAVQFLTQENQQAPFMGVEHLVQRTTPGPSTKYMSIAATQPSHPVLGRDITGLTAHYVPPGKYKCIRCRLPFPSIQMLLRHRVMCLAKECVTERLTCTQCNKTFTSTKAISDHRKEYHSTDRQHVCNKCGRRFTIARALEKHIRTHK